MTQVSLITKAEFDAAHVVGHAGTWDSGTTYASGKIVIFGAATYISKQDGNLNHTPNEVSSAWWNVFQPRGTNIVSGTGAPSNATGVDGDFYFDLTAKRVYGPKISGAWPAAPTTAKGDLLVVDATGALKHLPASTGGYILTVDGSQALGLKWAAPFTAVVDAKGDLMVASGDDTIGRLPVGATNGWVLTADSSQSLGVKWAVIPTPSGLTTIPANNQTGNYTFVLSDAGKVIEADSASAIVVTVPNNTAVAFPIDTIVEVARLNTGTVTLTPAGGVTIKNRIDPTGANPRTILNQYSSASLRKRATNEWVVVGDIA